jgi:aryl-alcohol dehydrogenase-like predicted oxidoreductase
MVNREIEKEVVPQALKRGIAIIPYSPLQRGLLTGKITRDYKFSEGDSRPGTRYYKLENIDRINAMLASIRPIAERHGVSLSQLVINWTVNRPAVGCVLVGARNEQQVKDNAKGMDFKISDAEMKEINKAVENLVLAD